MNKLQNISIDFIFFTFPSIDKMNTSIKTRYFVKKKVENMVLL